MLNQKNKNLYSYSCSALWLQFLRISFQEKMRKESRRLLSDVLRVVILTVHRKQHGVLQWLASNAQPQTKMEADPDDSVHRSNNDYVLV